jgi:mono/diheme cytochrome c family protein
MTRALGSKLQRVVATLAVGLTVAFFATLAVGLIVAVVVARLGDRALFDAGKEPALLPWEKSDVVASGRLLYADHCATCHGANGEGEKRRPSGASASTPLAPPHDASGHTWQHPDYALVQLTKSGVATALCRPLNEKAMPKFERTLTDAEIVAILSYIKSTWPPEIRAQQDSVNRLYATQNAAVRRILLLSN